MSKIVGQLKAILGLDKSKFDSGLKGAEKGSNKFMQAIKKVGGAIAAAFAIQKVVQFGKKIIELYDIQAKAEQSLLVALKGREDIQQSIIKQASELQKKTLFGDEQTIAAAARLAMLLGQNEDAIKRLLPLVQDFAQAKFEGNLITAADMIAKSVGSSTNALSRYGITIEGAVGSSDRLESAIEELNRQVGGQAESAANVGTGALVQLQNAWGDALEVFGKYLAQSEGFKTIISGLQIWIDKLNDKLAEAPSKFAGLSEEELKTKKKELESLFDTTTNKAAKIQRELGGMNIFQKWGGGAKILNEELSDTETEMGNIMDDLEEIDKLLNKKPGGGSIGGIITGEGIQSMEKVIAPQLISKGPETSLLGMSDEELADFARTEAAIDKMIGSIAELSFEGHTLGYTMEFAFGSFSNMIADSMFIAGDSMEAFGKLFADFVKNMIARLVAATIAAAALAAVLSIITGGGASVGGIFKGMKSFGEFFKAGFGQFSGFGMASGGTVPMGFPNDTFPAMLTSKERVLTPAENKAYESGTAGNIKLSGEFRIKGTDLVLVYDETKRRAGRVY